MLLLNIFAHLALNAIKLLQSIKHIKPKLLLAAVFSLLLFAQCKNNNGKGEEGTKSLEDSLAEKYGKGSDVIAQLSEDITNSPDNPELYYRRALQWVREERPAKAISDIKRAVDMDPQNPLYRFAMGEVYFANDSISGALDAFKKAIELKPDFTDAMLKIGELQLIRYEYPESNATFDKLLGYDANNAQAYYCKGRNYREMKDTLRAIDNFKKAVSIDNDYYEAYLQLGALYYAKQPEKGNEVRNLNLSVDYYTNAIRIKELSTEAFFNRGQVYYALSNYYKSGMLEKALRDYEKVMTIDPDDYRPYIETGLIYYNLGRYEESVDYYEKGLRMNPEFVKGHYLLGLAYFAKGDNPNAIIELKKVVAMDDSYTIAKEILTKELGVKDLK